jgi:hypothetical protein
MPRMLGELHANKAAAGRGEQEWWGFHLARTLVGVRGPTVVQYWRSVEDIYRYASDPEHTHRPAWAQFNARAREHPGAVGIWHETHAVDAGGHESIYHGTTEFGLGAVTGLVPVRRREDSARQRLGPRAQASRSARGTRTSTGLRRDTSSGETA